MLQIYNDTLLSRKEVVSPADLEVCHLEIIILDELEQAQKTNTFSFTSRILIKRHKRKEEDGMGKKSKGREANMIKLLNRQTWTCHLWLTAPCTKHVTQKGCDVLCPFLLL